MGDKRDGYLVVCHLGTILSVDQIRKCAHKIKFLYRICGITIVRVVAKRICQHSLCGYKRASFRQIFRQFGIFP